MSDQTIDDFVAYLVVQSHSFLEGGQFQEAYDVAVEALEEDPLNSPALRCLALVSWATEAKKKSLKFIQKSILDTGNGTTYY